MEPSELELEQCSALQEADFQFEQDGTRRSTQDSETLALYDLVQLGVGETSTEVLALGEVGQIVQDRRVGSTPFLVQGPRGKTAWYRAESIVAHHWPMSRVKGQNCLLRLVVEALDPRVHLDFPKVTEICVAAAEYPAGTDVATAVLVATLGEQKLKPGDARSTTLDYLKVLTIFNEMVYNHQISEVLRSTPGLKPALERFKAFRGGDQGDVTDTLIRMLATEIDKHVFHGTGKAGKASDRTEIIALCSRGHLLVWQERLRGIHIHARSCALCEKALPKKVERYNCPTCIYYNCCVSCARWGSQCRSS